MLRHAVRLNSLTELAVTKLDVLDTFETIRVCVGYRIDGNDVENYPDLPEVLERAERCIDLEGWHLIHCSTNARRSPPQAQALISLLRNKLVCRCASSALALSETIMCCGVLRHDRPVSDSRDGSVWSDVSRIGRWLEVELLATEAHATLGIVPHDDAWPAGHPPRPSMRFRGISYGSRRNHPARRRRARRCRARGMTGGTAGP